MELSYQAANDDSAEVPCCRFLFATVTVVSLIGRILPETGKLLQAGGQSFIQRRGTDETKPVHQGDVPHPEFYLIGGHNVALPLPASG